METNYRSLNEILEPNVKFEIPIYQRTYDWNKNNCRQLYDDIVSVGQPNNTTHHFIGAITYVREKTLPNDVNTYQIIDGQQRLTTLLLLLRALRDNLEKSENVTEGKINQLLFNNNEKNKSSNYYKLILTEDDNSIFQETMESPKLNKPSNIVSNFEYFKKWLSEDGIPDIIWHGIKQLALVQILIDENDDAQAIFESMNSTGLDLSSTDMIQNYLLMSETKDWQKKIYKNYWRPMEKNLADHDEDFEDFLRDYLMMHREKIVSKKEVYEYFKKHMIKNVKNKEKEIQKMYKHSEYYANLIYESNYPSPKLNKIIKYVRDQETSVANPLLLKLLADYANEKITENEIEAIFLLVDSYLLRCHVCDMTKGGNKVFPELISHISENDYVKSIEKTLMSKTGNRRFPRDITFKEKLEQLPLYMNRTMCKYILVRLEHEHGQGGLVDATDLGIEHIMPQKLNDDWKNDLGIDWKNIHEKYIHIVGNLTLTDTLFNSTVSNKRFSLKLDTFKNSNVHLTRSLQQNYKNWNEETIKDRTRSLTENAVKLWACPKGYDDGEIDIDPNILNEDEYLDGKNSRDLWMMLKKEILQVCNGSIFHMNRRFGSFILSTNSKRICSITAQNNKITLVYNTKIQDKLIPPSNFVRNISNIRHYGPGHFSSTIISDKNIDRAINLVKIVYESKL